MSKFAFRKGDEKIAGVAIRSGGKVYSDKYPAIHADLYEKHQLQGDVEDGFVTNKGRYVNRQEAAKIADNKKQTWAGVSAQRLGGLGSEHLKKY